MYRNDTIAAISTPIGEGGIGIVRVSGDRAAEICAGIFVHEKIGGLKSHRFYYGSIADPVSGKPVDEAMVVLMRAPRSYTREDVLEIQCHGGYLVVREILDLVLRQGARLAEPGEFTKRAFLNGRIDLVQAEAVIDIIRGKTETAVSLAQHQREGQLSARINEAKEGILQALALVEAYIDFPEEDIDLGSSLDISQHVVQSLEVIDNLLEGFREGRVFREGVSVMIAGKPNVGKSSLLNTLLKEKRAIVTSIPGTTRDIIEEVVQLKGLPVRVLDTAGIRKTDDVVEQEGVRMAMEKMSTADLVLAVFDASKPFEQDDQEVVDAISGSNVIIVVNKCDLEKKIQIPSPIDEKPSVEISTATGSGIDSLREAIFSSFVRSTDVDRRDYVVLSQARQRDSLARCKDFANRFLQNVHDQANLEILAIDLREALQALGEITGETTPDEILDIIFQRFCIGK